MQLALRNIGYDISLQQAEQLWRDYSHNNYAGWMAGGESIETAEGAIADLCHDINFDENHIGVMTIEFIISYLSRTTAFLNCKECLTI
ncbi:hypothetical protein HB762_26490 (plasmid) [Vibrio campbellii]|uniref:Uncharacterized protein n=1 Tax=Vibrio campbellii TaxID=680 RepID=A0ABY5IP71_9VIBR|nr:hypothetical protein [Vibrio campbellii]UTZ34812.1 hypothetical protein HB762_26490 [Vibrio campbellii]